MTAPAALTRDEVRDAFAACLTYADVQPNDVRALEGYIAIECARLDRELAAEGGVPMQMHPPYRMKGQPQISQAVTGGIECAFLRVSGFYFSAREAVSFNDDGFIGFARWADDRNVQPFLRGFMRWMSEWMGCTKVK